MFRVHCLGVWGLGFRVSAATVPGVSAGFSEEWERKTKNYNVT